MEKIKGLFFGSVIIIAMLGVIIMLLASMVPLTLNPATWLVNGPLLFMVCLASALVGAVFRGIIESLMR